MKSDNKNDSSRGRVPSAPERAFPVRVDIAVARMAAGGAGGAAASASSRYGNTPINNQLSDKLANNTRATQLLPERVRCPPLSSRGGATSARPRRRLCRGPIRRRNKGGTDR
ncbi:hypothetical protein EVAR_63854_1 [Eumeta japonica]|uniref:Uncharacterized protein n=1 Tax=Eumeta variegata TaxID=151549 RepID=A0A4C1Z446_EUMVA|nr:hypothetical protein EVAR_63854_1 [Eumeta japonica]